MLIPASGKATAITFGTSTWRTARGELSKDASGGRTAMVLFSPGVAATAAGAGGAKSPLAKGTFRVTEHTVGDRGPGAMFAGVAGLGGVAATLAVRPLAHAMAWAFAGTGVVVFLGPTAGLRLADTASGDAEVRARPGGRDPC